MKKIFAASVAVVVLSLTGCYPAFAETGRYDVSTSTGIEVITTEEVPGADCQVFTTG